MRSATEKKNAVRERKKRGSRATAASKDPSTDGQAMSIFSIAKLNYLSKTALKGNFFILFLLITTGFYLIWSLLNDIRP